MRLSLRLKFILIISAILLVIFALITFFFVRNARNSLSTSLNQQSTAFASLATKPIGDTYSLYKDSGSLRIQQQMRTFAELDTNIDNIVISSVEGSQLFSYSKNPHVFIPASESESFNSVTHTGQKGLISQITQPYFDDAGQHPYGITYHVSTTALNTEINREVISIVIFSALGLVISALATYEFINTFFLQPIKRVSQLSAVIASGYYSQEITLERNDEIGDLAHSVNRMAQALKANIQQLQELDKLKNEFIMITSHNLRTPLTIIEGNVSLLSDTSLPPNITKMVKAIEDSSRNLNLFSEQMLTIASIEAGHSIGNFELVSLSKLLQPLQEEFKALAAAKHISYSVDISNADTVVQANGRQLTGAVRNLIDNALKFTHENGHVSVTAGLTNNKIIIKVSDSGIGIKPDELPKIFTKFHRGTSTMQYDYEGTGIGLYVAKLIIEQHRGTISATSQEGKGSTFTVELPMAQSKTTTLSLN